jgi:hypothetical protein
MIYEPKSFTTCEVCGGQHHKFYECDTCAKRKRLSGITCPCCKGSQIEEGGVYISNGIIGPGYTAINEFPHLFCLDCGVIFKNLKAKT